MGSRISLLHVERYHPTHRCFIHEASAIRFLCRLMAGVHSRKFPAAPLINFWSVATLNRTLAPLGVSISTLSAASQRSKIALASTAFTLLLVLFNRCPFHEMNKFMFSIGRTRCLRIFISFVFDTSSFRICTMRPVTLSIPSQVIRMVNGLTQSDFWRKRTFLLQVKKALFIND